MDNQQPDRNPESILKRWSGYIRNPFYRNALFLIVDSLVTSGIGFFFWALVARFYSATDVGYASAAISAMTLLSSLSLLGFNYSLIRFLPTAGKPVEMINTGLTLSGGISLLLAAVFLLGLEVWSPALNFIKNNLIFSFSFAAFTLALTLFNMLRIVFIARRRADLVLSGDTIQSLIKIILAVFLVSFFHSFGIITAWGIATAAALLISLWLFRVKCEKTYKPWPSLNADILGSLKRYSAFSYLASILTSAATLIMPIIVVNLLGSEQNAYFYIAWTISGLLNAVSVAVANSLFVEGSHFDENLGLNIRKAVKFAYWLLIPAVIIVLLFGRYILGLFGPAYSSQGLGLLRIMALASLFGVLNLVYFAILRIKNRVAELCVICAFQAVASLAGGYFILPLTGAIGIGYVWLGVQALVSLYVIFRQRRYFKHPKISEG